MAHLAKDEEIESAMAHAIGRIVTAFAAIELYCSAVIERGLENSILRAYRRAGLSLRQSAVIAEAILEGSRHEAGNRGHIRRVFRRIERMAAHRNLVAHSPPMRTHDDESMSTYTWLVNDRRKNRSVDLAELQRMADELEGLREETADVVMLYVLLADAKPSPEEEVKKV